MAENTTDFRTPAPRNERGQFLPRNDKDTPIGVVLAEEEEKRSQTGQRQEEGGAGDDNGKKKPEERKPAKTFKVDGAAEEFYNDFFGAGESGDDENKAKSDKEKETADKKRSDEQKAKAAAEQVKKEKEAEAAKASAARTPPRRAAEANGMTAEQIANLAAETAARVAGTKKPDEEKKDTAAELPPGEQRKVNTLKHMEEMFGEKYKNASTRYQTAQIKLKDYAAQWEKENVGKKFDESAEEHEQFFQDNDLFEFWDADDFDEARIDLLASKRQESKDHERNREINVKLGKLERAERLREEAPKVRDTQIKAAKMLWKNFGDQYAEVMGDSGWNKEKSAEISNSDPVGYSHRLAVAQDFDREAGEIYKLYNGLADYNPNDEVHKSITQFYMKFEAAMIKASPDIRTDPEGRMFMASKEYYNLSDEKRDKYWTFSADDVIFKRAQILAKEVESQIKSEEERFTKYAEVRGWKKPDGDGQRQDDANVPDDKTGEEADGKPVGPSAGSETKVAAMKNASGAGDPNSQKSWHHDV